MEALAGLTADLFFGISKEDAEFGHILAHLMDFLPELVERKRALLKHLGGLLQISPLLLPSPVYFQQP